MEKAEADHKITDSGESGAGEFLSEKDWNKLIRDIHNGQVIPFVGPELITVTDNVSGEAVPLHRMLAPALAVRLELKEPERFATVNETVCAHLLGGGRRKDVYDELREILDDLKEPPSETLCSLARIADFDFYLTSSFDHQMLKALVAERPDFDAKDNVMRFHPSKPVDVPEPLSSTRLMHILGDYDTYPDFAVWDEDYMEFVCSLIENSDTLECLFRLLKNRHLLLLGAPCSDWIVRFLLRASRQERLSERGDSANGEYFTDQQSSIEAPMVFFFDKLIDATRFIDGSPAGFVAELSRRWQERYGQVGNDDEFLARIPDAMPKDSVFISYAREDLPAALAIARALHSAGVPVWLDKGRLRAGENYETELEAAVRVHCSFFISLISDATEADTERKRYVHTERDWAATCHFDGYIFYVPVSIRAADSGSPKAEPKCFSKIHYHRLPGGEPQPEFTRHIRSLVDRYRSSGRPRG